MLALSAKVLMPERLHDVPLVRQMFVGPDDRDEAIFFYASSLFFAAFVAYLRIIFTKRRRTLEAYDRAIGTLQMGNYYQGVLKQVM